MVISCEDERFYCLSKSVFFFCAIFSPQYDLFQLVLSRSPLTEEILFHYQESKKDYHV